MKLAVLTPTRDRPVSMDLLCRWLARQTDKDFTHIVVDDGKSPVHHGDMYFRREPSLNDPSHTLPINISHAWSHLREFDAICFAEDDEWLHPMYVERIKKLLQCGDLVGEQYAKYYFMPRPSWRMFTEHTHCSLCRTAISRPVYDFFEKCLNGNESIDMRLWKYDGRTYKHKGIASESFLTVSLKAIVGRLGTGGYHRRNPGFKKDHSFVKLRQWVGNDYKVYRKLINERAAK